jgi:hypothetical protein
MLTVIDLTNWAKNTWQLYSTRTKSLHVFELWINHIGKCKVILKNRMNNGEVIYFGYSFESAIDRYNDAIDTESTKTQAMPFVNGKTL